MLMYKHRKKVMLPFEEAVEKLKKLLMDKGFKTVLEMDVNKIFKEKLGKDFPRYKIISACNPSFSYEILNIEKDLGVFLPCSFVVYEDKGETIISASLPTSLMRLSNNEEAIKIASEVDRIFIEIISSF